MITRILTNAGAPLTYPDGSLATGIKVTFELVTNRGVLTDVFDSTTGERIPPKIITAPTDANGVFSVPLWPTTRGDAPVYYLCKVPIPGVNDIVAPLPDNAGPYTWVQFKAGGVGGAPPWSPSPLEMLDVSAWPSLADAIGDISTYGKTLWISTPVTCNDLDTTGRDIRVLMGGRITVNAGHTLTIGGGFDAGLYQVFAGAGSVMLSGSDEVAAEWFATLSIADAVAYASGKRLVISSVYTTPPAALSSTVKIVPGGKLNGTGATTINGAFEGCAKCFGSSQTITFSAGAIKAALPEWWGAAADGVTDSTAALNAASAAVKWLDINNGQDTRYSTVPVKLSQGVYITSGWTIYPYNSIEGVGRGSVIQKKTGTTGPVISYNQTPMQYVHGTHMRDFSIVGTGQSTDATNDGLVLSPYYGIDGSEFRNIWIIQCGGAALRITPSAFSQGMVLQQSMFSNVTIRNCGRGVWEQGFVGNVQWNSCTFDNCTNETFKADIYGGVGSQDQTFINCAFQKSAYGFWVFNAVNAVFVGCHFETNSVASYYQYGDVRSVAFYGCTWSTSPQEIMFAATASAATNVYIGPCTWKAQASPAGTDRFINNLSTTLAIFLSAGQTIISDVTTRVTNTSNKLYGFNWGSKTLSAAKIIGLLGISATNTEANNLSGEIVPVSGNTTDFITFPYAEADVSYDVFLVPSWGTTVCYLNSDKATTGVTIRYGTACPASGHRVRWLVVRR